MSQRRCGHCNVDTCIKIICIYLLLIFAIIKKVQQKPILIAYYLKKNLN